MAKEYNIAKGGGACGACQGAFEPQQEIVAVVLEDGEGFQRRDFCMGCWNAQNAQPPSGSLAVWRTRVAESEKKKRVFVDDGVLLQFFRNLEGTDDPNKIGFRFVLALVLMRKKLLAYEGSRKTDQAEIWTLRLKGAQETFQLVEARMDDEKVAQISSQLGEILQGDL